MEPRHAERPGRPPRPPLDVLGRRPAARHGSRGDGHRRALRRTAPARRRVGVAGAARPGAGGLALPRRRLRPAPADRTGPLAPRDRHPARADRRRRDGGPRHPPLPPRTPARVGGPALPQRASLAGADVPRRPPLAEQGAGRRLSGVRGHPGHRRPRRHRGHRRPADLADVARARPLRHRPRPVRSGAAPLRLPSTRHRPGRPLDHRRCHGDLGPRRIEAGGRRDAGRASGVGDPGTRRPADRHPCRPRPRLRLVRGARRL